MRLRQRSEVNSFQMRIKSEIFECLNLNRTKQKLFVIALRENSITIEIAFNKKINKIVTLSYYLINKYIIIDLSRQRASISNYYIYKIVHLLVYFIAILVNIIIKGFIHNYSIYTHSLLYMYCTILKHFRIRIKMNLKNIK